MYQLNKSKDRTLCLAQLLKTQEELERLRAEKQPLPADALNELQDHNTSLISRMYDKRGCDFFNILYVACFEFLSVMYCYQYNIM